MRTICFNDSIKILWNNINIFRLGDIKAVEVRIFPQNFFTAQ